MDKENDKDQYDEYQLNIFNSEGQFVDYDDFWGYEEPKYCCEENRHKWVFYQGFHLDKFWFCEMCDKKDFKRSTSS
jgi:hypothetical protein